MSDGRREMINEDFLTTFHYIASNPWRGKSRDEHTEEVQVVEISSDGMYICECYSYFFSV